MKAKPQPRLASYLPSPGWVIAGAFVAAAGFMSITFWVGYGYEAAGLIGGALFALVAVAVEGYKDFCLPLLFGRRRSWIDPKLWLGLLFGLPLLGVCLGMSVTGAHRFAQDNLFKREAAQATKVADHQALTDKAERARKRIAANTETASPETLQAEIEALLRKPGTDGCKSINGPVTSEVCPQVDKLKVRKSRAEDKRRDEAELAEALEALKKAPAVAVGASEASLGPVGWLLKQFGYEPGSWPEFMAGLIMLAVELGAFTAPLVMSLAARDAAGLRDARSAAHMPGQTADSLRLVSASAAPQASPPKRVDAVIEDVSAFLDERTERCKTESTQAVTLYNSYVSWKLIKNEEPISPQYFGTVLSQHLGLAKVKRGVNRYLGIRLRVAAAGSTASPRLQVVAAKGAS